MLLDDQEIDESTGFLATTYGYVHTRMYECTIHFDCSNHLFKFGWYDLLKNGRLFLEEVVLEDFLIFACRS